MAEVEGDQRQAKSVPLKKLQIGDHIYRPKSLPFGDGGGSFLYCHHAIVSSVEADSKDRGTVIGFGRKDGSGTREGYTGEVVRTVMITLLDKLVQALFDGQIKEEKLCDFENKDGTVFLYEYGVADSHDIHYLHGVSTAEARNGEDAAEVAKLFLDCPSRRPFGDYSLSNWNCESFASFCKTTTLSAEELETIMEEVKLGDCVPRDVLLKHSAAKTYQIKRLIKNGFEMERGEEALSLDSADDKDIVIRRAVQVEEHGE